MTEHRYALVLGHNRPELLKETVNGIINQVHQVWVHDNASDPPLHDLLKHEFPDVIFIRDMEQPPNLAKFWNNTLDQIELWHQATTPDTTLSFPPYKVAVLTDDLDIPADWFGTVAEAMDRTGAAAGCSSGFQGRLTQEILKTRPDGDLANRMYGPAFILRGELQIRADERLKWWYNDTDMDWRARQYGGMIMVPGPYVHNKHPNESTIGVNAEQTGRDREAFQDIWGHVPW